MIVRSTRDFRVASQIQQGDSFVEVAQYARRASGPVE